MRRRTKKRLVLAGENEESFRACLAEHLKELGPLSAMEEQALDALVSTKWRLRRVIEQRKGVEDDEAVCRLMQYEVRLDRALERKVRMIATTVEREIPAAPFLTRSAEKIRERRGRFANGMDRTARDLRKVNRGVAEGELDRAARELRGLYARGLEEGARALREGAALNDRP